MGGNNSQNTMSLAIFLTYYLIYLFMNAHVQAKAFQCVVFESSFLDIVLIFLNLVKFGLDGLETRCSVNSLSKDSA
jgi:hypothetical protein